MSRHDPQVRLRHMLEYAREAIALTQGRSRSDLDNDRAIGLAVARCLEIVGEAAARMPEEVQKQCPGIPWPQVIAMRNRLIHGYDLVDYDIVWSTIREDLPLLISELEKIVAPS